jgi:hypothetical protein
MAIYDLFSKRRKRERGEAPDVYQYHRIPEALRVQIVHIWRSAYGDPQSCSNTSALFKEINDILCQEYGVFSLSARREEPFVAVMNFMLHSSKLEEVLDVIELSFKGLDGYVRENPLQFSSAQGPDDAIADLNARFLEHGVGYQYESGQLIRVDSQLIHTEVVQPALRFLTADDLKGANEEFLSAHSHYRSRKYKECLSDCLKAFESILKCMCDRRQWSYKPTDTAKALLQVVFDQGLIPSFLQSHFTSLRTSLEAGLPTVRNKLGGHGQGGTPVAVPTLWLLTPFIFPQRISFC